MRHALAAMLLVVFAGCGSDRLHSASSEVRVTPEVLRWDRVFVGHPATRTLKLQNAGRIARTVELSAPTPFSVDTDQLELPAGGEREVSVQVLADHEGSLTGELTLTVENSSRAIPLLAETVAPPDCDDAKPCHQLAFDPVSGECVDTTLANGTECEAPCVVDGRCTDGECLGSAGTCDDGNACTQDACDPAQGSCVHFDASDACVAPAQACKVPYCDPVTGCGVTDAMDGTHCGPADCVSADICLSGVCKSVPVPEGATCASASPCQDAGVCHQQQCVRPAATELQPAWSYTPGPLQNFFFPGVSDAFGNLYWVECGARCELVSFDRDGNERYRQLLHEQLEMGSMIRGGLVLVGSSVAVATRNTVELFRATDGVPEWGHNLRTELIPNASATAYLQLGPILDIGGGRIAVRAIRFDTDPGADPLYTSWIVALSTTDGTTQWTWQASGFVQGVVAEANGSLWLYEYPVISSSQTRMTHLSSIGIATPSPYMEAGEPLATYDGRLVVYAGQLLSSVDGSLVSWLAGTGGSISNSRDAISPLLGNGFGYTVGRNWGRNAFDVVVPGSFVRRFNPKDGEEQWAIRLDQLGTPSNEWSPVNSQPVLLGDQSVLVAKGDFEGTVWQLVEVSPEGSAAFVCDLPMQGQGTYDGRVTLSNGRWTVVRQDNSGIVPSWTVMSFDVGDAAEALNGWTSLGGGPEGTGRPH